MKAWYCRWYNDHDSSVVVWAETRGKARHQAANEMGDAWEWMTIQAKRLPAADGLTDADLTPQWWLDHGYWVTCSWCDEPLRSDDSPIVTAYDAYCNARCQAQEAASRAKYRERSAELQKRMYERLDRLQSTHHL